MPKQKSHSGAKKRFKVAKSGAVKFARPGKGHFLAKKSQDRKRKLRRSGYLSGKQAANIRKMINA